MVNATRLVNGHSACVTGVCKPSMTQADLPCLPAAFFSGAAFLGLLAFGLAAAGFAAALGLAAVLLLTALAFLGAFLSSSPSL